MKSIKKPHLDHTQALASYVSGSIGTLKCFWCGLENYSLTHTLTILVQKY